MQSKSDVKLKSYIFVLLLATSVLLPTAQASGEGDNPVEQHWTESGTIQIEHTINETQEGVPLGQYLNTLTSDYHSPHIQSDNDDNVWMSYSNSGVVHMSMQEQDTHFKTVSAISGGHTLMDHHYVFAKNQHNVVAEAKTDDGTQGLLLFTSSDGIAWDMGTWILGPDHTERNNPWLTRTDSDWRLYWNQPHGTHQSLHTSISENLHSWTSEELVFPSGHHSFRDTHPASVYHQGVETLVWVTDKFDDHTFMGSDVEKTVVFSQRALQGDWSDAIPIRNQFGNDENPIITIHNDFPVVVWDSDRVFHPTTESEGIGHGGTNIWYSMLMNTGWTEPVPIAIQQMHRSSPTIYFGNDAVTMIWEQKNTLHMSHTHDFGNELPVLESFKKSIELSVDAINEVHHIVQVEQLDRFITIMNDGDFTLRGEITSTEGLTLSHHLINLAPGESFDLKMSASINPLDNFHGIINIETNSGNKKIGVDFITVDAQPDSLDSTEEVSDEDHKALVRIVEDVASKSDSNLVIVVIVGAIAIGVGFAVYHKRKPGRKNLHADEEGSVHAPKAVSLVIIMVLMSLSPFIQNVKAEEINSQPFLADPVIFDWDVLPDQDFNLTWPCSISSERSTGADCTGGEDDISTTRIWSNEFAEAPQPLATFPNCWDRCDQKVWELEILKQEFAYDRWVNVRFDIRASVDSYPYVVIQDNVGGTIEYYNLSSILDGITGDWQEVTLELQKEDSFISRKNGDATMYFLSPVMDTESKHNSASMMVRTIGQNMIPPAMNHSVIPMSHKLHYDSGNILRSSTVINGDSIQLLGSVHRTPTASLPTSMDYDPTSGLSDTSMPYAGTAEAPSFVLSKSQNDSSVFDLIVKEYEHYKWFNDPNHPTWNEDGTVLDSSSSWQECGDGGFLCPANSGLNSEEIYATSSPFDDNHWELGTYQQPLSQQYIIFDVEYPSPQISSVTLNYTSDPHGNRHVNKSDSLTFDIRLNELYTGINELTFEAMVVDVNRKSMIGVISRQSVPVEYYNAIDNRESLIQFNITPDQWYLPDDQNPTEGDIHKPVFLPFGHYAIIISYADTSMRSADGKQYALGKHGVTDDGVTLIRDELISSSFIVQPGPVITNASVVLPTAETLGVTDNTKVFILNAEDANWEGVGTREYSTDFFAQQLDERNIPYGNLTSTSDLELLINSDMKNVMIINTHGPVVPTPFSYFTNGQHKNGLLGEWDFETTAEGILTDQSVYQNHAENNGGIRTYDAANGAKSLYLNESKNFIIHDYGETIVFELTGDDGEPTFCISVDGLVPEPGTSDCYDSAEDAYPRTSRLLYPVNDYRMSFQFKVLAPHSEGSYSIIEYGTLMDDNNQNFWNLEYNPSMQAIHFKSDYFEQSDDGFALEIENVSEDTWYELDLVVDDSGAKMYLDSILRTPTAGWSDISALKEVKNATESGFKVGNSNLNFIIDDLWISSEASSPSNDRQISESDITNAKNWIGRIGHWMEDQGGKWVQTNGLAFSTVSNKDIGWEDNEIKLDEGGLELFMTRFGYGDGVDLVIDDEDEPYTWTNYEYCEWEGTDVLGKLRWTCQDDTETETGLASMIEINQQGAGYQSTTYDTDYLGSGTGLKISVKATDIISGRVNVDGTGYADLFKGVSYTNASNVHTIALTGHGKGLTIDLEAEGYNAGIVDSFEHEILDSSESYLAVVATDANGVEYDSYTNTDIHLASAFNVSGTTDGTGENLTFDIIATEAIRGIADDVSVTSVGSGYANGSVVINNGLELEINATEIVYGRANQLEVFVKGTDYHLSEETIFNTTTSTGSGSGLTVRLEHTTAGVVSTVDMINSGGEYTAGYYANISTNVSGSSGTGLTLNIAVDATGNITLVTINTHGEDYSQGDVISINTTAHPEFSVEEINKASFRVSAVTGGEITKVYVEDPGQGYSSMDTVVIDGGNNDSLILVTSVVSTGGNISKIAIKKGGHGFVVNEDVSVPGGDGNAIITINEIKNLGGVLQSIIANNSGDDFEIGDNISIKQNNATINVTITNTHDTGGIHTMTINETGANYAVGDYIAITDHKHWKGCSAENGFCDFTGRHMVRYGADHHYYYGVYEDGVQCNSDEFGDPAPGKFKHCRIVDLVHLATFKINSVFESGGQIINATIVETGYQYTQGDVVNITGGHNNASLAITSTSKEFDDWWYYCEEDVDEGQWYCTDELGQNPAWAVGNGTLHDELDVRSQKIMSYIAGPDSDNSADGVTWTYDSFLDNSQDTFSDHFSGNLIGHTVRDNVGMISILSHQHGESSQLIGAKEDSLTFYHPVDDGGLFYHGGVSYGFDFFDGDACTLIPSCTAEEGHQELLQVDMTGHRTISGTVSDPAGMGLSQYNQNYVGISLEDYEQYKDQLIPGAEIYFGGSSYYIDYVGIDQEDEIAVVNTVIDRDMVDQPYDPNQGLITPVRSGATWHLPNTRALSISLGESAEMDPVFKDAWSTFYNQTLPYVWENIDPLVSNHVEVVYHIAIQGYDYRDGETIINNHAASCGSINQSLGYCPSYVIAEDIEAQSWNPDTIDASGNGVHYIVETVSDLSTLDELIHSNIRGAYLLNSHGDIMPFAENYFTGLIPMEAHEFLYDFELSALGMIQHHIYDRSGNDADARLYTLRKAHQTPSEAAAAAAAEQAYKLSKTDFSHAIKRWNEANDTLHEKHEQLAQDKVEFAPFFANVNTLKIELDSKITNYNQASKQFENVRQPYEDVKKHCDYYTTHHHYYVWFFWWKIDLGELLKEYWCSEKNYLHNEYATAEAAYNTAKSELADKENEYINAYTNMLTKSSEIAGDRTELNDAKNERNAAETHFNDTKDIMEEDYEEALKYRYEVLSMEGAGGNIPLIP